MPLDIHRADLHDLTETYSGLDASQIVRTALRDADTGKIALVSSFGAESVVLLHMVAQIDCSTPVLFLDTEMLFAETLHYQREVADTLGLTDIRILRPGRKDVFMGDTDGLLHRSDPDACCHLRKTLPLERALRDFDAWLTGRKRFHGGARTELPLVESNDDRLKINPLANWRKEDVAQYISRHGLPRHPLVDLGYPSIGCQPCTTRAVPGETVRAGRWRGQDKNECGIHLPKTGLPDRAQ